MARAPELSSERYPWVGSDVMPQIVASADWGELHPALCYEFGDEVGDSFIPTDVISAALSQQRLVVALWQPHEITYIDLQHTVERTFAMGYMGGMRPSVDWCDIQRFTVGHRAAAFLDIREDIDPRPVVRTLFTVLETPLGAKPAEQGLASADYPLMRVLIEFPHQTETRALPLDTSITALSNLATQEYLHTIYGPPKV